MALSRSTANKIVAAVVADPDCQRVINWPLISPTIDQALPPAILSFANGARSILEFTQSAGAMRNTLMLLAGKEPGDASFDEKICLGISLVTLKAILKAMSAGRIPEIRSCSAVHRVTGAFHVHHQATCVQTADRNWYVFDWHATLRPSDPAVSKQSFWLLGTTGINYVFFSGFD
jgi:hypothetical protein